jgi:hypothetical protein
MAIINGYWWILMVINVIILMIINGYFINGYWWLLIAIDDSSIGGY